MEWNKLLGLSPSVLGGRTVRLPQLLPGPGQTANFESLSPPGQRETGAVTSLKILDETSYFVASYKIRPLRNGHISFIEHKNAFIRP